MGTLLVTAGHPGSGKTYFSEHFSKKYNFVHLSSDFFRTHMFPNTQHTLEENEQIFSLIDSLIFHILSNNISVILDTNCTKVKFREKYKNMAEQTNSHYFTLFFQTPVELSEKRVKERVTDDPIKSKFYKEIPIKNLHFLKNATEEPEEFENPIFIDGEKQVDFSVSEVFKKIYNL